MTIRFAVRERPDDDVLSLPVSVRGLAPQYADLCALGPLLCLYPRKAPVVTEAARADAPLPAQEELIGLVSASEVRLECLIDNQGPHEGIWFCRDAHLPLFGVFLLPDTDYLAWDRLIARALTAPLASACRNDQPRFRPYGYGWTVRFRRFRLLPVADTCLLTWEPVGRVSTFGLELAERIIRERGAEACGVQ